MFELQAMTYALDKKLITRN